MTAPGTAPADGQARTPGQAAPSYGQVAKTAFCAARDLDMAHDRNYEPPWWEAAAGAVLGRAFPGLKRERDDAKLLADRFRMAHRNSAAEVVRLEDELGQARAELAGLRAQLAAVRKLADEAKPGTAAMCTCYDCERYGDGTPGYENYTPHPGRVMSWKLNPADILKALGGACCDLHGRNCEPPSELCCENCTEVHHGAWLDERNVQRFGHPAGETCPAPDALAKLASEPACAQCADAPPPGFPCVDGAARS